jgi:hypothetical protein
MSDHEYATAQAQRVLRGEEEPRLEITFMAGVPLDFETGVVRCPKCGLDTVRIVQAHTYPSPSYPEHAAIFLDCRTCGERFAVGIDAEDGRAILRTSRLRG